MTRYPPQRPLGGEVEVILNYDTSRVFYGRVVREDAGEPYVTIFQVGDKFILATECQYRPLEETPLPVTR